ncbi:MULTISPECIES: ANTAR domain-containing response regulator [Parasedimentitalea]|uniref:ANTAR domain-containing protein n=2 Tax=Parasedimentitalea TaxID=2738399 RepID=A0A6L6WLU2_9RHOB|nr:MULTISPECIES: ANTAR domain-containing protein [Zongyanglinia]KAE9627186.1 ANTAR domain-containing protein [Zongyanglinia marina]MVO17969.1 ANTAR domain-containing protein [Zongyanglinia huanghaiensis]
MRPPLHIPDLSAAHAVILHRPHTLVQAIIRQLTAIGLNVSASWPELGPEVLGADFVFFDVDMGYDEQFPWAACNAPMPLIALIGSEAPGRIEWAIAQGSDAQLLKPVGDSGVYSALLIARQSFEARQRLQAEISDLRTRLSERQTVVQAVTLLAASGKCDADAYGHLRQLAMSRRETIEQAAQRVVARLASERGSNVYRDNS